MNQTRNKLVMAYTLDKEVVKWIDDTTKEIGMPKSLFVNMVLKNVMRQSIKGIAYLPEQFSLNLEGIKK